MPNLDEWLDKLRFWQTREWAQFARLLVYFKPYAIWIGIALTCALIVGGADGATAYLVKPAMDKIFANPDKTAARVWLGLLPAAIIIVYIIKGAGRFFQNYILRVTGQRVIQRLRERLYEHYQWLSLEYYTETNTGVMMSRITNDVNMMEQAVPALTNLFREPITLVGLAVVAVYMWWQMALIMLVLFAISGYPMVRFGKRVRKYTKRGQEHMGVLTAILKENFSGIRVIKAFAMERYELARFKRQNELFYRTAVKRVKYDEITAPMIEALGSIGAALVVLYGGSQVLSGEISSGAFFSFLASVGLMYEPLKRTSRMNNQFQGALAAAERVFSVLDTQSTIADRPDAVELPPITEGVHLENLHFRYAGTSDWVLRGIDLKVKVGQTVAIVGSSGSGKTTLINLLARFYDPTDGRITIDGHDLRDVTGDSLRRQLAMVTQETFLFDDTVTNNIAYGQADAERERVESAATMAYAHDFITSFPNGYETSIGELGVRLSGGQRQRLAIARALYKNAPILILDEATSSLDTESERQVQLALENLMRGRTTFVIAHRLSTIRRADRIVVLHDGRIVEDGRHEELIALGGEYARLYDLQFQEGK